ncbi:cystatin-like fold lipoprotein [Halobacillus sp. Marseille-Q1614]|uniref:cystatin-like fold lipoprotein n=1 Tax=Halobacillus sp. Marseille-Q1614 TaxID=2709134 RepID=UPI00156D5518|nr:cystatin-like fold lipoprotein [Halobacillus sp. Marseille-Q1614]
MKKWLVLVLLGALALGACSPSYDQEIEEVIEKENKSLQEPGVKKDIETLEREDAQIAVYEDGKYIKIAYMIRSDHEADSLYESSDNGYEINASNDLKKQLNSMEPDYTENMEDS